ncbi:MAG: PD40 domain-containing protein, partial [Bryobacterales bacterium]|nr:PD40 domain-containing protein [Bryobacterales bacterium]
SDRAGADNLDIWVKQVGGSEPIRLTQSVANENEPSFSPDGTSIVYRSDADGGGIYVVPALGGRERRVAGNGRHPRFSPDGRWIAYWAGKMHGRSAPLGFSRRAKMYVAPASGGPARQLRADFAGAAYPVWSPDGRHILFLGQRDTTSPPEESVDWWVTPLDDTAPARTEVFEVTRKENLSGPIRFYSWALVPAAWDSAVDSILFSANAGDSTNLWRVPIDSGNWKVTGTPIRLTSGPALEENPSVAWPVGAPARVAFAVATENTEIFSLPVAVNEAKVLGEARQLTTNSAADFHPSTSPDGRSLVFVSNRTGDQEVWIKDLASGQESALTATRTGKYVPLFSPDGSQISFSSYENLHRWETYVVPATGGAPEKLCDGLLFGWSSDGTRFFHHEGDWRLRLFDMKSRRDSLWAGMPGRTFCCGRFSPDNRWVAFFDNGFFRSYIAPFRGESPIPEHEWIDLGEDQMLWWSPDGNTIYGQRERDGHLCLWAQRLDPATKRLAGPPLPIFHSHSSRRSLGNQANPHPFVSRDRIVFSMGERTANIWMAEFR